MRIVFDATPLSLPRTGIGNYLRGALGGLARVAAGEHEVVALALVGPRGLRAVPAALDGVPVERAVRFLPLARAWRTAWSRAGRPPLELLLGRFDVLHFSDWWYPPQRAGVRATTVYDLIPLRFPEWVDRRTRRLHGAKYRAVGGCDLVFVISEFTAREVEEVLGTPRERIRVAPPGVDPRFRPDGPRPHGRSRPYVLALGAGEPRKNVEVVAAAVTRVADGVELVTIGSGGTYGYVDDGELAALHRGAAVLAYPSRYEGFGMPILEAMASGTPVVASSHPSLDEACGDAALRADPDVPDEWEAAIRQALAKREELGRRGLAHARAFTWERVGRVFLDAFAEAVR